jgi:predicted metal-dependent phosphotriesterase family hydrolase
MGTIDTVLGAIKTEDLGFTYIHEHILTLPPLWRIREDPDYVLDSRERIVTELQAFRNAGGKTLVDATAIDYGRDVTGVMAVAKQVDVNLLMITGFNRGDYHPEMVADKSIAQLEELFLKDIDEGINGTAVKAGIVKLGTSYNLIRPEEEKITRTVGRVQKKKGIPVMTHTTMGTMALEQLELLEAEGADLTKVAISHVDQNLDFKLHREIVRRGAYALYDGPSKIKYGPDSARIEMLTKLIDAGYEKNIMISGDMGRRSYLKAYGGGPGFEFLLKKFVPRLNEEGWDPPLIDRIFITNPANYLTYR